MANDTTLDKVVIEFDGKVNKFDASIDTLIEEIKGLREQLKGMGQDAKDTSEDIEEETEELEEMNKGVKILSASMWALRKTTAVFAGLTKGIVSLVEKSTQAVGIQTRFNSVFSSTKDELKGAKKWVDEYSNSLYLDSAEVMDAASNYKLLARNIGLSNDEANTMAENLTKISYDLKAVAQESDVSIAQSAISSALGGEAEAMKHYGVMLNQATLQQTLYSLGIDRTVASLNAAEKAQLIYYQIMNTTAGQQGYYAKTLMSPANALNILKTQFRLLGREVGNVFIPILMELLPVIIAITEVLKELARWLAGIFNIDIDFEDITSGVGDITNGIGGIGDEADKTSEKVKNMTRDFDKLHVVNFDTGSGSGETGGIGGGSGLGNLIDLTPYKDWNAELDKSREKVEKIKNWLYEAKDWILAIVGALATYKVAKSILDFFDKAEWFSKNGNVIQAALGIGLTLGSLYLLKDGIEHLVKGEWTAENIMKTAFGIMGLTAGIKNIVKGFTGTSLALSDAIQLSFAIVLAFTGFETYKQGLKEDDIGKEILGMLETAISAAWIAFKFGAGGKIMATIFIGTIIAMMIGSIVWDWDSSEPTKEEKAYQEALEKIDFPTPEERRNMILNGEGIYSSALLNSPSEIQEKAELRNAMYGGNILDYVNKDTETNKNDLSNITLSDSGLNKLKEMGITIEQTNASIAKSTERTTDTIKEQYGIAYWTASDSANNMSSDVSKSYNEIKQNVVSSLKDTTDKTIKFSDILKMSSSERTKTLQEMIKEIGDSNDETVTSTKTMVQGVTSEYKSMQVVGTESITSLKTSVIQNAKLLEQGGVSSVRKFVNDSISNMKQMKTNGTGDMTTLTSNTIATLKELQRSGNPEVAEFATASLNEIKNMTSMVKKDTDDMQKTTVNKFSDLTKKITSTFDDANPTISKSIDKIKGLMNFDWQLPKIKLPKFSWTTTPIDKTSWAGKILSALNMPMSIPKLNLDWFAGGGFPDTGSLFVANEREPELIGSWGNKSMVANSTQIIKGIESASYNGMKRALTEVPMSNETNVYVGNKQLTDVVTKQQRRNNNKYGR